MARITFKNYMESGHRVPADMAMAGDALDGFMASQIVGTEQPWEQGGPVYLQDKHVFDSDGEEGIYETVAREAEGLPFRYLGRCPAGIRINLDPAKSRRIFICTPFRSDTIVGFTKNVSLAAGACFQAFTEGWFPVAPHLYFPTFLQDRSPRLRYYGMQAGKMLMEECEKIRVYRIGGKLSAGQEEEVLYAAQHLAMEPEIIDMTEDELNAYLEVIKDAQAELGGDAGGNDGIEEPEPRHEADPDGDKQEG